MTDVNKKAREWLSKIDNEDGLYLNETRYVEGYRIDPGDVSCVHTDTEHGSVMKTTKRLLLGQEGGFVLKKDYELLEPDERAPFFEQAPVKFKVELGLSETSASLWALNLTVFTISSLVFLAALLSAIVIYGIGGTVPVLAIGLGVPASLISAGASYLIHQPLSRWILEEVDPEPDFEHLTDDQARQWVADRTALKTVDCPALEQKL